MKDSVHKIGAVFAKVRVLRIVLSVEVNVPPWKNGRQCGRVRAVARLGWIGLSDPASPRQASAREGSVICNDLDLFKANTANDVEVDSAGSARTPAKSKAWKVFVASSTGVSPVT